MKIPRRKRTRETPIRSISFPRQVSLPLTGLRPVVAPGDRVRAGALVATEAAGSPWILRRHAPLTGVIKEVGATLVIEGEAGEPVQAANCAGDAVAAARECGLVGMGGGGFPTYVKLERGPSPIRYVVANGCESEPYVTCDHRVLAEHGAEVESGLRIAKEALQAEYTVIADKEAAYPAGDERLLLRNLFGLEVPRNRLPRDVGVVVLNVQTLRSLHHAFHTGRPLIDRVITVDGNATGLPGNYTVPIGTPVRHLLEQCETALSDTALVLAGGPMMGKEISIDAPITACDFAILALTRSEISRPDTSPCIRCGRCMDACPYGLCPMLLVDRPSAAARNCVACGACEFVCPGRRPLVSLMRLAKERVSAPGGGA